MKPFVTQFVRFLAILGSKFKNLKKYLCQKKRRPKSKIHFIQTVLYIDAQLFYVTDFFFRPLEKSVFFLTFPMFFSEFLSGIKKCRKYLTLSMAIIKLMVTIGSLDPVEFRKTIVFMFRVLSLK